MKNIQFTDVKQNTKEWWAVKLKKASSSNFAKIMANGDKFGKPALEYAYRLALEIVTEEKDETNSFRNKYMERGNELEHSARERYEQELMIVVENGGFFHTDKFGDSPDGNVTFNNKKGAVEFKVVIAKNQRERIKKGGYDTTYKWQIAGHFLLGEKDFVDYVQYCPEMPINKQLYVCRIMRSEFEDMIESLKIKLELFWQIVEEEVQFLKSDNYECINI